MFIAALLAAAVSSAASDATISANLPVHQCLSSMDGAVYHGDPTDRALMKSNVAACTKAFKLVSRMPADAVDGAEKLMLEARILDRAATLSYMGLDDARTAMAQARTADLYFRIASALPDQSPEYRDIATVNATLTSTQLDTLRSEIAHKPNSTNTRLAIAPEGK